MKSRIVIAVLLILALAVPALKEGVCPVQL
jgi:hypothetical protein